MARRKGPFKNALCLEEIPEAVPSRDWIGLSYRHRRCQRKARHAGPHRSWSREWEEGAGESRRRDPS
jgi:hypothetical protein